MTFQDNPVLGRFTEAARAMDPKQEEIRAAYEHIDHIKAILGEARLQLEYLHEKFNPTGTTETVLARIDEVLS